MSSEDAMFFEVLQLPELGNRNEPKFRCSEAPLRRYAYGMRFALRLFCNCFFTMISDHTSTIKL